MDGAGDFAALADDVDDGAAAALAHALHDRVDHVDVGEVLGVHRVVPRGGREFVGRGAARGACRVDEHVDGAEGLFGGVEGGDGAGGVLEVGGVQADAAFGLRERGDQRLLALLQVLQVARDQAHARAFAQEAQRAGQADALAAAGDENVLVLELEVHVGVLGRR
ncbi:hypothetical protein D9M68_595660 [compost metagenome]